ncbi:transmembrane protein 116 isoform X2 [Antennarius striatus]
MALLSVLGSASTIICVMSQRLSWMLELQPLVLLSLSDLMLAVCWLIGASVSSWPRPQDALRFHLRAVGQVLFMASCCHTLSYVWHLYAGVQHRYRSRIGHLVQVSNRTTTANRITALLSSVLPVLLMAPVFIQGGVSRCHTNASAPTRYLPLSAGAQAVMSGPQQPIGACGLLHAYSSVLFLSTFILTLLIITVLGVRARRLYRRAVASGGVLGRQQRACVRLTERRMLLFPLVLVFCWGPAVGVVFLWMTTPSGHRGEDWTVLSVVQVLPPASQGLLNHLVYLWTRAGLRQAGGGPSRDVDMQTPLLRAQRGRSYQTLCNTG